MFVPSSEQPATPAARYAANLAAIRLLRGLGDRPATDAERETLAGYVGWGGAGLAKLAAHPHRFGQINDELGALLTPQQASALLASVTTAFYTPSAAIRVIWDRLLSMGLGRLERPRILEPAAGIGAFIGHAPEDIRERGLLTAVELDPTSASICRALYPEVHVIASGFEAADLPRDYFDVVVGNVPFGDFGVVDPSVPSWMRSPIHDYFFAKAAAHVRVGGVVAFLTSLGTMDKGGHKMRAHLGRHLDLVAVLRLPSGTFPGTEAAADLVILRRRLEVNTRPTGWEMVREVKWSQPSKNYWGEPTVSTATDKVNAYFVKHPTAVIGTHHQPDGYAQGRRYTVTPPDGLDLPTEMRARLAGLVSPSYRLDDDAPRTEAVPVVKDATPNATCAAWLPAYTAARALLDIQTAGCDDSAFEAARAAALDAYRIAEAEAPLAARATLKALEGWGLAPFVRALHDGDGPAPLLLRRTLQAEASAPATLADAIHYSLGLTGRIDVGVIAEALGSNRMAIAAELEQGALAYRDPATEKWVPAAEYLSGNVAERLKLARLAARTDPGYQRNVAALVDVQPAPIPAGDIKVSLGARWVPSDVYQAFALHLFGGSCQTVRLVEADSFYACNLRIYGAAATRWGTGAKAAAEIFEACINLKPVKVYSGPEGEKRIDSDATLAAQTKAEEMREAFTAWVWADSERVERLVHLYNDRFGGFRRRQCDGSYLAFPGMAADVELRRNQRAAVARALQSPRGMDEPAFIHPTGAGKTFEILATAVKGLQIGAWKRCMIVVPNHLLEQWHRDAVRLYPGWADRIAAPSPKVFGADRQTWMSRIAMGRWPIVIITHSQMTMLPVRPETFVQHLEEEVARLQDHLEASEDHQSIKRVQKAIRKLQVKIESKEKDIKRDSAKVVTFEDLRIDCLMVDESQVYKNLGFQTRLEVAGLSSSESNRAFDAFTKTQLVQRSGGRVIFATATPVANTLAELHIVMRFLQGPRLKALGLEHFDAFASVFTETYNSVEMAPSGDGYRVVQRLRYHNLPELVAILAQSWDVCRIEDLGLTLPALGGGAEQVISIPGSDNLKSYIATLAKRAEAVKNRMVKPDVDNMLRVTSDGRKAAMLNGDPAVPAEALTRWTKIHACAERVLHHYRETAAEMGAQLVFCDLYTPRARGKGHDLDDEGSDPETPAEFAWAAAGVYGLLRHELEAGGIAPSEIAYIHDADTPAKKATLHAAVNAGTVRVLIGSTEKMSTGLNVQARLIALHHLDTPWRPDGIIQRNGRALRQGNAYATVWIYIYVTAGSFDAYMWGLQRAKLEVTTQVLQVDVTVRSAEDIGDAVLTASQVQAIATGDPRILERVAAEGRVVKLDRSLRSWLSERHEFLRTVADGPMWIRRDEDAARACRALAELAGEDDDFSAAVLTKVGGRLHIHHDKGEAHEALRAIVKALKGSIDGQILVGSYRGADVWAGVRYGTMGLYLRHPAHPTFDGLPVHVSQTPVGTFSAWTRVLGDATRLADFEDGQALKMRQQVAGARVALAQPWPHAEAYRSAWETYRTLTAELSTPAQPLPMVLDERAVPEPIRPPEPPPVEASAPRAPPKVAPSKGRKVPDTQLSFGWQ